MKKLFIVSWFNEPQSYDCVEVLKGSSKEEVKEIVLGRDEDNQVGKIFSWDELEDGMLIKEF